MAVAMRAYRSERDLELIRTLLVECIAANGHGVYCTLGDLDWWRAGDVDPDAIKDALLWFDGDRLVAFGWSSSSSCDMQALPGYRWLEPQMIDALAYARLERDSAGGSVKLLAWCMLSDEERCSLLRSRGYAPTEVALSLFTTQLTSPTAGFQPGDIVVRPVDPDGELRERVDLHRAAFAPSSHTIEKYRRAVASPTYRADLDLVAEATDGRLAAFCIIWYDDANQFGLFEPVGCHPHFQRRGYGRAVMLDGLRRLRDLGASWAWVNAHATDARSNAFYQAAGFNKVDEIVRWEAVSTSR